MEASAGSWAEVPFDLRDEFPQKLIQACSNYGYSTPDVMFLSELPDHIDTSNLEETGVVEVTLVRRKTTLIEGTAKIDRSGARSIITWRYWTPHEMKDGHFYTSVEERTVKTDEPVNSMEELIALPRFTQIASVSLENQPQGNWEDSLFLANTTEAMETDESKVADINLILAQSKPNPD